MLSDTQKEEIYNTIKSFSSNPGVFNLNDETSIKDLSFTSMNYMKMIIALESAFDFEFPLENTFFDNFPTVGALVSFIESQIN